mgnify:CR=1 FL=1
MLKDEIKKDIAEAVKNQVLESGSLDVEVTRTSDSGFGDFTTNIALKVSHKVKQSPMEFAKLLAQSLQKQPYLKKLEVVKPGFLNFFVKDDVWQKQVDDVLKQGGKYGSNSLGQDKKARVEFVSANPTGPLHFGNARGGPIGDSLASVLAFCGYKVTREYLHNNVGVQIAKLGESIANVASGKKLEDQEYKGEYILDLINKIKKIPRTKFQIPNSEEAGERAVSILLDEILKDCEAMGIKFDEVYPEGDFVKNGQTQKALAELEKKGVLKKKDGAIWFAPSDEFLKDRETVVKKSDGNYTYFANDIVYHNLKFTQNPALVVDILGANHHGHVPRLQAVVKALGYDVSRFHVILYQWVRFKRNGRLVAMSKRSGTFVSAREVLDEIGRDALRFFILMHDAASPIDFDLDLAREKSKKNPVYYVQYAHARIISILAKARGSAALYPQPTSSPALHALLSEKTLSAFAKEELTAGARRGTPTRVTPHYQLLTTNYELDLIKQISRLPELVEDIAGNFAVHRLTAYAIDLADSFHKFYENCRVIGESSDLELARLDLITATKIALANTLSLLGVSAPEKM